MTIGRTVIAKTLRRRLGLAPQEAKAVVEELFGTMGDGGSLEEPGLFHQAVMQGRPVVIRGFAKIERRTRKARVVTPPATGGVGGNTDREPVDMPDTYYPHFVASKAFKRLVADADPDDPEF